MICDFVNGLVKWASIHSSDRHLQELSQTIVEKSKQVAAKHLRKAHRPGRSAHSSHTFSPIRLLLWTSLFVGARTQLTNPFPAQFELSSLDGSNGFILNGEAASDFSGYSVSSAGEMNGDGLADLVIGAYQASSGGKSYVIYGSRTPMSSGTLELSSLDGSNGFIINGEAADDRSGYSVSSAGDMNGDGLSNLVIGAYWAAPSGRSKAGKSYVVYGNRTPLSSGTLDLSSLDGTNGFILNGEAAYDRSGRSVSSAGDLNGDGLTDLVIGASSADPLGRSVAGKSYVIYGSRNVLSSGTLELSSLNGSNGFIINGEAANDHSGHSVSSAGDMNGDGLADLVIGAYGAAPSGRSSVGKSYVIYGSRTPLSSGILELSSLDGSNGFILNGEAGNDQSGRSVSSAGDLNGDGLSDLVIGAHLASPSGRYQAGKSYVIYGNRTPLSGGTLELSSLNGSNGFILNGEAANDRSGSSVSSAGDLNGDGLADLVIGAFYADPAGRSQAGKSYVIYGSRTPLSSGALELSSLNGANGFTLNGETADDYSGFSVSSAGDLNGDGLSDLVIGANNAAPSGRSSSGKSYVIYGRNMTLSQPTPLSSPGITLSLPIPATTVSQIPLTTEKLNVASTGISSSQLSPLRTSLPSSFPSTKSSPFFQPQITDESVSKQTSSTISTPLEPQSPDAKSPTSSSSIPLIVGIAAAVTALACSVFGGIVMYKKKRSSIKTSNPATTLNPVRPDSELPAGYADISKIQTEMHSARVENEYAILPQSKPSSHYKEWPKGEAPHTTDHYNKFNLEQLNDQQAQHDDAKIAAMHANYDEIPTV